MYADFISRNKALIFNQDNATEYRKRIAASILNGNLNLDNDEENSYLSTKMVHNTKESK